MKCHTNTYKALKSSFDLCANSWSVPSRGSFKVNFNAIILNGEVRIKVVTRGSKGGVMFAMESNFPMAGSIELAEAIDMF